MFPGFGTSNVKICVMLPDRGTQARGRVHDEEAAVSRDETPPFDRAVGAGVLDGDCSVLCLTIECQAQVRM